MEKTRLKLVTRSCLVLVPLFLLLLATASTDTAAPVVQAAQPQPTATLSPVDQEAASRVTGTPDTQTLADPSGSLLSLAEEMLPIDAPGSEANKRALDAARAEYIPTPVPLSHRFTPQRGDIVTRINRGVYHIQRVTNDPLRINVLLFDMTLPEFDVQAALGDDWFSGRTRTSYMVRQTGALAGINGDLFAGLGRPQGLTVINSRVAVAPKHRATFAWTRDREPFIGYFTDSWTWDAHIEAANGERTVLNEYNRPCLLDQICLHTEFVRYLAPDWRDVKVLLGPSGRVLEIVEGEAMRIEPGMRVLQGIGEGADWILDNVEVDDTITFDINTTRPLDDVTQAISGGPIILQQGLFTPDCMCKLFDCSEVYFADPKDSVGMLCEDFDTYWKESHYDWVYMPRTGIGYDRAKQTLIVAVVDGYQLGYSRGVRQIEFANLLREFGAYDAMELDGGGSTTMVLDDTIVNNPSDDTGERHVANALLFFWNEDQPEPLYPAGTRQQAGNGIRLLAR
jgi:hypothetical protein